MPDAITGNWRAVVKAGGAEFTKILKVEAIKPNRLKILWDAAAEILPSQTNIGLSAHSQSKSKMECFESLLARLQKF